MSKNSKRGKAIVICVLSIWVAINCILVFGVKTDDKVVYIILNIISSTITTCFIKPSLGSMVGRIKAFLKINSEQDIKKSTESKAFFAVLITLITIGFILLGISELPKEYQGILTPVGGSNSASEYTSDAERITTTVESTTMKYDFFEPSSNLDVYFSKTEVRSLLDILDVSLTKIPYIEPISDDELEIAVGYGDISPKVVAHETELNVLLNNPFLKEGPLPEATLDYIVNNRLLMEKEYQTPANRKLIADAYLNRVIYKLSDNIIEDAENAVRFTWGRIYLEIAWARFDSESINELITMYEHLYKVNTDKQERIDKIINALERLKIRADEHPFCPEELK